MENSCGHCVANTAASFQNVKTSIPNLTVLSGFWPVLRACLYGLAALFGAINTDSYFIEI